MRTIKIAFIVANLGQGGAEKQLTTLMTNLNPIDFEISLFLYATQTDPFYKESIISKHLRTSSNKLKRVFFIFKITEALLCLRRYLKKDNYDLIVTSLFMNNLFVRLAAPLYYREKIITNMRTSVKNYPAWYLLFEKILIKQSYIVFNTMSSLKRFKEIFPEKHHHRLSLIYNGFETNVKSEEINPELNTFGSLGRFSKEKNILQVVRVFQEIEKKLSNSRLIIQGDYGNQYDEIIKTSSSEKVEIRNKNPDVEIFYNSIKVLILPSLFEGCPNVLFEALLRRKICIVSAGANSDNFVENGVNGFVYDGTDEGLKHAMLSLIKTLNTPEELRIIEKGYNYAKDNFGLSTMVKKYEQLFIKIYEENKSCI